MTDPTPAAPSLPQAFPPRPDPAAYVPRLALESALAELAEVIGKTPACAALSGDAGLGKTLLLKVLRERLQGAFECLYVPYPRFSAPELWRWAAAALGLGASEDDRGAVLGRAAHLREEGSGLVLLVDDAGTLPGTTRAELLAALDSPGFSLVLALCSDDYLQLSSLPPYVRRVEVGPPMTLPETRAYVHARLRHVDPDGSITARLTADRLAALHEGAGGVPARLNGLLDAWLRTTAEAQSPLREDAAAAGAPDTASHPQGAAPLAVPTLSLPDGLRRVLDALARPNVRLALVALFLVATLAAWMFAWQRGPGVASVGVPVEPAVVRPAPAPLAPPPAPAAPRAVAAEPPPVAEPQPLVEPPTAPTAEAPAVEPAPEAEPPPASSVPAASAREPLSAVGRPQLSPLLYRPPLPDPSQPELPVYLASLRFPEEHVPPSLEPEPLAAPPAGPRLSVNARPWARISLDGTPVGETPLGELRVTPGPHVVRARLPDGRIVERTVEARAGDVYMVFP